MSWYCCGCVCGVVDLFLFPSYPYGVRGREEAEEEVQGTRPSHLPPSFSFPVPNSTGRVQKGRPDSTRARGERERL